MPFPLKITSLQNPRIKHAASLLTERKMREQTGLFAVEGAREIERALAAGYEPTQVFALATALSTAAKNALGAMHVSPDVDFIEVTPEVFAKLVVREDKDGLLVFFRQKSHGLSDLRLPDQPLILAVHGVEKPGNLGALLRSADGAGASAIVILDGTVDLYNPHVVRGSLGTLFSCQIALCREDSFRAMCHEKAIQVVAAALTERSVPHYAVDLTRSTAVLVGSEAQGLPPHWLTWADHIIKIPMAGIADSLNVSAAGAVILYEGMRQRVASTPSQERAPQ